MRDVISGCVCFVRVLLRFDKKLCYRSPPFPQIDIIGAVVIVWRVRGTLSGLFCAILCATIVHSATHTHMNRLTVLWIGSCLTGPISQCLGSFLWSPYVIGQTIIFLPCSFFLLLLLSSFFPRLISAVGDWMSTILLHMAWP